MMRNQIKTIIQNIIRQKKPVIFRDDNELRPISRAFGLDRGTPIDRYYIEGFLSASVEHIKGRCLEVGEVRYIGLPGSLPTAKTILVPPGSERPERTSPDILVADLSEPDSLPEGAFDCFICTQTLNFIYEAKAAVAGARRLLSQGGHLLGTVAGISQISRYDMDRWGDYWRFTELSLHRMLSESFGKHVTVQSFGNVRAAQLMLDGIAVEDLPARDILDEMDADYPVILGFHATRHD
jgi:hypothetical protein